MLCNSCEIVLCDFLWNFISLSFLENFKFHYMLLLSTKRLVSYETPQNYIFCKISTSEIFLNIFGGTLIECKTNSGHFNTCEFPLGNTLHVQHFTNPLGNNWGDIHLCDLDAFKWIVKIVLQQNSLSPAGKLHVCSLQRLFGNYVKSHVHMASRGTAKLCLGRSTSLKDAAFFDPRLSHVIEMMPSCQWLWRWILWDINSGSQDKNQRMSLDI